MYKLMVLCLIVLPSNAEAERVFSVQNWIKTKLRTSLQIERLDQLIRISYAKIPMEDFDWRTAVQIYQENPHRW